MTEIFKVNIKKLDEKLCHIEMHGYLDVLSMYKFKNDIEKLIKSGITLIIFDMIEVTYIGSTGLGTFIHIENLLHECGGHQVLYGLTGMVRESFDIIGFGRFLQIEENLMEAEKNLEQFLNKD